LASSASFRLLVALPLAALSLSCRSLDRFDTPGDAAFCGPLAAGPDFYDGFTAPKQIAQVMQMKLKLDTSGLSAFSHNEPVRLGFLSSNDEADGLCAGDGRRACGH